MKYIVAVFFLQPDAVPDVNHMHKIQYQKMGINITLWLELN